MSADGGKVNMAFIAAIVAVATIGGFYDFAGLSLTADAEKAMRAYLDTNRSDRYGKFTYSTDVLPVPVQQLHDEFAAYRERFGIDIETRH